jgi:WD40 repeat protein
LAFIVVCGGKWHDSGILAMEWINNETLITGSADGKLKIWTISSGQLRTEAIIDAQISGISVIKSLSGETSILVLRVDGKFEVFDAKMMKPQHEMKIVLGHGKGVVDLVTMADSFTTVSYDGKANQWKFENERIIKLDSFDFPCKHVDGLLDSQTALSDGKNISRLGVVESKEGRIVASNDDQVLYEDGSLVCRGDGSVISISQDAIIECAALSQTNLLSVMFEGSKSLEIYKISSSSVEKVANFPDVPSRITRMSFGGSGEKVFLVTADDQRRIKVYKATGSEWIREKSQWCSHSARIDTLVVDDKENIFSAGVDGHIMAWNLQHCPFEPLYTVLKAHSGPIAKLLLLPASQDGKVVLVSGASDSCIKLWNLKVNE